MKHQYFIIFLPFLLFIIFNVGLTPNKLTSKSIIIGHGQVLHLKNTTPESGTELFIRHLTQSGIKFSLTSGEIRKLRTT